MPNVMDYIDWRGDLTFEECPLCEVDNLIFCQLAHVDLDGIIPADPKQGRMTVRRAAMEYFFTHNEAVERPLGLIVPSEILKLFRRMADAPRYRNLELTGYVNEISEKREMQFSALTVRLPNEQMFVAFRGTDDTIVGWREDFNLSYMDEVPSQRMAADYLNALDMTPATALYVGGHSKGGNLAVWGAVHAHESVRRHIRRVFSNDGPGFSEGTVKSEAYRALADRITVILPESSFFGLLLEHDEGYTVVKSSRRGIYQHDGLSWEVMGSSFVRAEGLSPKSIRTDTVVRERIAAMTREEKQTFTKLMFGILESTGAKTLTELYGGKIRSAVAMLKSFSEMSREDKDAAFYLWDKLFDSKPPLTVIEQPKREAAVSRKKAPVRVELRPLFRK